MTTYRIWPATDGPGVFDNGDPVTLGTRFTLSATGWVTHLHYWRGTTNDSGTHTGSIYVVGTGAEVAGTVVTFTDVGTGWQTAALATPVELTASTLYVVAIHHPNGGAAFTTFYWGGGGPGSSGLTNGILTAPSSAAVSGQGVFAGGGTRQHPTNSFNHGNYWSDVSVSDTDPSAPIEDSAADNVGITDTATGALDYIRTPADTVGIGDSATAVLDYQRSPADGIGLADTAASALDYNRAIADTLALADNATAVLDRVREPGDPIGVTDQAAAGLDYVRTPSDTAGITDTATAALDAVRTPGDAIGMTDSVSAVLTTPGQHDPDWDFTLGPPYTDWSLGPPHV